MDHNWFTRFEQAQVDPVYLNNMMEATEYFMSWFPYATQETFAGMLSSMHLIACRHGYIGYTNTDGPYVATAGVFRGQNKDSWRPLLKKNWFRTEWLRLGIDGDKIMIMPVLKSQKVKALHHLVIRDAGYELHLPHEDHVPAFLSDMANCMLVLRDGFYPDVLANYIQYFVVGHPFERINFSICMAQVNAVLYHYGYEPMLHGYFDFDCFVYDHDRVEKLFTNRLRKRE